MDFTTRLFGRLLDVWQQATPLEFLQLAMAVVLVGWYFSRVTVK